MNFLLDEMPNIGKIPDFPKKLSTIRSRNMRCTICAQDIGQIKDMYPGNLWANVVSNCDTQYMLGCNDSEVTAPFWSNAYGIMTIIVNTERETTSRFKPVTINSMRMENIGEGKREVYTIGEICGLENKYALIRFRGHNVKNGMKFSYFEHPMYEEIEEENYFKHKPLWWSTVAAEAQNAQNLKEYEWFAQGIKNIEEQNIKMQEEEEFVKKQEADKKAAEAHKIDRAVNNGLREGSKDATIQLKIKVAVIIAKRWLASIKAYLENEEDGVNDVNVADCDKTFNQALRSTLSQIGDLSDADSAIDLDGTEDDTPIGAVDERVSSDAEDTNTDSEPKEDDGDGTNAGSSVKVQPPVVDEQESSSKLQKRIRGQFKEAAPEEQKKPDHKKSLVGSLETSSILSHLKDTSSKTNDKTYTKPNTKPNVNSHSNSNVKAVEEVALADLEPDDIPEIPEPDFEEPEAPAFPWTDSWGSFEDFDEPDEPEINGSPDTVDTGEQMVPPKKRAESKEEAAPDVSAILGALSQKKKQEDAKKERIRKATTQKTGGL